MQMEVIRPLAFRHCTLILLQGRMVILKGAVRLVMYVV